MKLRTTLIVLLNWAIIYNTEAQDGMDHVMIPNQSYAKLRIKKNPGMNLIVQEWERAIGIYQTSTIPPRSSLEINTNFTMTPAISTNFNDGEMFRTDCRPGSDSFWRMERDGQGFGLLSHTPNIPGYEQDFNIESSQGSLRFFTAQTGATQLQRIHINGNTGGPVFDGWVGFGTTDPEGILHLHEGKLPGFNDTRFILTNGNTPGPAFNRGLHIRLGPTQIASIINRPDQDMIFGTRGDEIMRIFANTFDPLPGVSGIDDGVRIANSPPLPPNSGIGIASIVNGFGGILGRPRLLVVGSDHFGAAGPGPGQNFTIAEFRNPYINGSSSGIKIRGSRGNAIDRNTAHMDLSNYDRNEGAGTEFIMARVAADMHQANGQTGILRIFTNEGTALNGLTQKVLIDRLGRTGIGLNFNNMPLADLPQNRLEITSEPIDPEAAGLRFTNLTCSDIPVTNCGQGVLAVDDDGDVIYVDAPVANGVGFNSCGTPTALSDDVGLDMNGHTVSFIGNGSGNGEENNVYIGNYSCPTPFNAKLKVDQKSGDANTIGLDVLNEDESLNMLPLYGIRSTVNRVSPLSAGLYIAGEFLADNITSIGHSYGIRGTAKNNWYNTGVFGFASGDDKLNNTGVYARASGIGADTLFGVKSLATGSSSIVFGVNSEAKGSYFRTVGTSSVAQGDGLGGGSPTPGSIAVGGYFYACYGEQNIGIYAGVCSAGDYAAIFNGNVYATGSVVAYSDKKLKKDIKNISTASEILSQLEPKTYFAKGEEYPAMNLPSDRQYGLIAQEAEKVLPEIVKDVLLPANYDNQGNLISEEMKFKGLDYQALVPILIQGFKDQQESINQLQAELEAMKGEDPSNFINSNSQEGSTTHVNLASEPVLYQNAPNPFDEGTTIRFFVPKLKGETSVIFSDNFGKVIKEVPVLTAGLNELDVAAVDLAAGIYTYSLVIDGQIVDTKKMVKSR